MRAKVKKGPLNVRAVPSTDGAVLGRFNPGQIVEVVVSGTIWSRVVYGDDPEAFVGSKFLEMMGKRGKITATSLNVRDRPGGNKLGSLPYGEVIDIIDETDGWVEFEYKGREAFVSAKYVTEAGPNDVSPSKSTKNSSGGTRKKSTAKKSFLWQNPDLQKVTVPPTKKVQELSYKEPRSKRIPRKVWNLYGNLLTVLSDQFQVDVASAVAFLSVESGGDGFGKDGRMLIRFENHWMWNLWGKKNEAEFKKYFKFADGAKWKGHQISPNGDGNWMDLHGNQSKEWQALELGRRFDNDAALQAISMGAPQVMGFNAQKIGYDNVQQMFDNFNKDIRYHILGLFDFFNDDMIQHMRNKDFVACARGYNGPGQAKQYGQWIKEFYDEFPKDEIS